MAQMEAQRGLSAPWTGTKRDPRQQKTPGVFLNAKETRIDTLVPPQLPGRYVITDRQGVFQCSCATKVSILRLSAV